MAKVVDDEDLDDARLGEPIDLDSLEPVSVPVSYAGAKYVLREADEATTVAYKNACMAAARMNDGKLSGIDGLANASPLLVGRCLFKVGADGKPIAQPVGEAKVRTWPGRVVKPLFARAKRISQLEEAEETAESLEKSISKLQGRLAALRAGDAPPKDTPGGSPDTSTGPTASE